MQLHDVFFINASLPLPRALLADATVVNRASTYKSWGVGSVHVLTLCVLTGNSFPDSSRSAETQTQEDNNLIGW